MSRVVVVVMLMSVAMWGKDKTCAFGLTPQTVAGSVKQKPHIPTAKEQFDAASSNEESGLIAAPAIYIKHQRQSCPYERAIELFGEDRVEFKMECTGCPPDSVCACGETIRKVLVDGEEVYRETVK